MNIQAFIFLYSAGFGYKISRNKCNIKLLLKDMMEDIFPNEKSKW